MGFFKELGKLFGFDSEAEDKEQRRAEARHRRLMEKYTAQAAAVRMAAAQEPKKKKPINKDSSVITCARTFNAPRVIEAFSRRRIRNNT
jgi:hypothetical protein